MATMESALHTSSAKRAKGGSFLIEEREPRDVFTPEDLSEEQRQIAKTASEFARNEVMPATREIEAKNFAVTKGLLRKAGELGLMGVDVPESVRWDGDGQGHFRRRRGVGQQAGELLDDIQRPRRHRHAAHRVVWHGGTKAEIPSETGDGRVDWRLRALGVHVGFGRPELPHARRALRRWQALRAQWREDVDHQQRLRRSLHCLREDAKGRSSRPFSSSAIRLASRSAPEEHKLGIRGSSTCPLILADCRVPVENLLGEAGKGHHIAFNTLNMGRFKLGAACVGGARQVLQDAIQYAKERKAFGKSIAEFGLIQEKLAECAAGIYTGESLVYRTIGMIDAALADVDPRAQGASHEIEKRIEEYAVECSIVKVWVSEMLQMVANHSSRSMAGTATWRNIPPSGRTATRASTRSLREPMKSTA